MRRIVMALAAAVALGAGPALADEAAPAKEAKGKELFLKYNCNSCHTVASQSIAKKAAAAEAKEAAPAKEAAATKAAAPAKEAAPAAESSSKRKTPDLSAVGVDKKADWIAKYLQKLEAIKEKKHMKKFAGTNEELTELAAWLEAQKDVEAAKKVNEAGAVPAKDEAKGEAAEAKEAPKTE